MLIGSEPTIDYVCRTVYAMLYVDDACIVSQSPRDLANMVKVIAEVCPAFAITVSEKKNRNDVSVEYTADDDASRSGQANLKTNGIFHLPVGGVTKIPGMFTEIVRCTCVRWMSIRRSIGGLYDHPKAPNGEGRGNRGPTI